MPDAIAMSSSNVGAEEPPFPIQNIIERLTKLRDSLVEEAETNSPDQQITAATDAAANNQTTANEPDGSNGAGDVRQENQQEGVAEEKTTDDQSNQRKEVAHELGKLCKELQYLISSFEKLQKFETNLSEPLKTLEANVNDILKDLCFVKDGELPKQVPLNLRVLRNNITRVKIQIPLQHQTANTSSEANQSLQTTVATREAEDLPHLYDEDVFESSYYFKEMVEKYKQLGDMEKLCLLCFAIFPENVEIKKRLLRFWWVGENLFPNPKVELDLINETLDKFVKMGFVEAVKKKNKLQPRSYKMNPIVRSCLIKFAKVEGFFDYDLEGKPTMDFSSCKKSCMVKSGGAPVPWFSKYLKDPLMLTKKKERLSADLVKLQMLFNFPDEDTLYKASKQFHELQTLFNISKQFPALPKEWFSKMTDLNVLYLGKWETTTGRHIEVEDVEFLKGLKYMKKLRLLSLQGISGIPKLPSALCKLENLRILDLRACHSLEKLPDRIGSLKKLTYLDFSECYLVDDMPKQLNRLEKLEVLKGFVIGEGKDSCTLKDLSGLKNLRKLSVSVNTTEFNIDEAEEALENFKKLEKLKIAWGSGGLTRKDSMQDSSKQLSDQSNTSVGQSKSKSKASAKAAKPQSEKEKKLKDNRNNIADDHKGDDKNQKERNKRRDVGETKQVTGTTGSQGPGIGSAARVILFTKKLKGGKKAKNHEGLGKLVKLDLQCFPRSKPPDWLVPTKMTGLTNLCIRGGKLGHLIQEDEEKWEVKTLRLKFLVEFKMNWKEMQERFPKLEYLENVRCPRITFCPCDANGVWQNSSKQS
ncbi:hypothetical protein PTKIN_Ptkin04bG0238700 [Pterospermum kingtungense]